MGHIRPAALSRAGRYSGISRHLCQISPGFRVSLLTSHGGGTHQADAGKILGIKQPHVSALMGNRSGNFSVARLMEFLTALDQDVQITVRPKRKAHAEMSVLLK